MVTDRSQFHSESLAIDGLRPRAITDNKIARVAEGRIDVVQQAITAPCESFTEAILDIKETKREIEETIGVQ